MSKNGSLSRLYQLKAIFLENKNSGEFKSTLNQYFLHFPSFKVRIVVEEMTGVAFGGFKEIRLFGCVTGYERIGSWGNKQGLQQSKQEFCYIYFLIFESVNGRVYFTNNSTL